MIRGVITVGFRIDQKNNRLIGNFLIAASILRESNGLLQLSIITTPSCVTTKLHVVVVASGAKV